MKKVTLQTIADHLKVSKALVSKALSNDPTVSEATRETIWRTASELGYRKKGATSTKAISAAGNISVLMPNFFLEDLIYWGELIRGIHDESARCGFNLLLNGVDISLPPAEGLPSVIQESQIDGVIALGHIPVEYLTYLKLKSFPLVLADGNIVDLKVDHVLANNFWGAKEAVMQILQAGHVRIAFVGDPQSALSFAERKRGFEEAITEFELEKPSEMIVKCFVEGMGVSGKGNYISEAFASRIKALVEGESPVTAMFCASDMVAIEVLRLLDGWGVSCPKQVSVCGFDDLQYAARTNPRLSTMSVPRMELGIKATQLLIRRIENPQAMPEYVLLPTEFISRESIQAVSATN